MATVSAPGRSRLESSPHAYLGSRDRLFYGGMALVMALVVFIGFAPTYYFRFFSGGPQATVSGGPFTPLVHLHGALFTGWVLLFVIQTALVASHRTAMHRRLGLAGATLAAAMVLVGILAAIASAKRGGGRPGSESLAFLAVPLFDMVLFATFVASALVLRRDKEAHKRLMLLAYTSLMAAAAARWPVMRTLAPLWVFAFGYCWFLIGSAYDLTSRGRVHKVYLWGGALLVASVPVRLMLSTTDMWRALAQLMTR